MTTLDHLIKFVDELDSHSLLLVDAVEESSRLISKMMSLTAVANDKDTSIEQMESRVDANAMFLDLVENLMEKTYLLESNMNIDNSITTATSLDNLQTEYTYLKTKFNMDNSESNFIPTSSSSTRESMSLPRSSVYTDNKRLSSIYGATDAITRMLDYQFHSKEDKMDIESIAEEPRPSLSHQISVSNLSLKPLRCSNTTTIDKKKSKYRVSKVYNINPVAYDNVSSIFDDTSSSIHMTPEQKPNPFEAYSREYNLPAPRRLFSNATETTLLSTTEGSAANNIMLHHENDGNSSEATEDISFTYFDNHLQLKHKSNSLPDIGSSDPQFGLYIDMQKGPDTRNMRNSRLKHFMSYSHFTSTGVEVSSDLEGVQNDHLENELNIESTDHLDAISMISDFSYYSPDKQHDESMIFEDDDNFNKFLRKSRLDLNKVLPPVQRSRSHDSIFQSSEEPEVQASDAAKFHNPIDTMAMSTKAKRLSPTVEPVYSSLRGSEVGSVQSTKSLLEKFSQSIPSESEDETHLDSSPLKHKTSTSFTFFNLVSPSKPKPITTQRPAKAVKGPTLSLKETFSLLVSSSSPASRYPVVPPHTPRKIRTLKEQYRTKTNPISIRSGSSVQRQPIRNPRTDGAHSLLSIGPNRTAILTHGDASYFKRPVVTKFNPDALRDALSRSID